MTKTEKKKLIYENISEMLRCELNSKNVGRINIKLINDIIDKYSFETICYCLRVIKRKYYDWSIDVTENTPSKNVGRIIYLINDNIEMSEQNLIKSGEEEDPFDYSYETKIKKAKDIRDYKDIAKSVGL